MLPKTQTRNLQRLRVYGVWVSDCLFYDQFGRKMLAVYQKGTEVDAGCPLGGVDGEDVFTDLGAADLLVVDTACDVSNLEGSWGGLGGCEAQLAGALARIGSEAVDAPSGLLEVDGAGGFVDGHVVGCGGRRGGVGAEVGDVDVHGGVASDGEDPGLGRCTADLKTSVGVVVPSTVGVVAGVAESSGEACDG